MTRVIPLESNPTIFDEMAKKLGLTSILQFHDILSITEPDLLAMIPQPVYGVIMLFPLTEQYEANRKASDGPPIYNNENKSVTWFKQTIGNGCGLYALLHLLANLPPNFIIANSILDKFLLQQLEAKSVDEVSKLVENLELLIQLDENYGSQGQSEAPPAEDPVELHFKAFIRGSDGHLYELDGRRNGPIDLGPSHTENVVDDDKLIARIQHYMASADEANQYNFSLMALAPSFD